MKNNLLAIGGQFKKRTTTIVINIALILVAFLMLSSYTRAATDTVKIVKLKDSVSAKANEMITEDMLMEYNIIKKEYNEQMVKASEKDSIIGKYFTVPVRAGGFIYKDEIADKPSYKDDWLYELEDGLEVISIPFDYISAGGSIISPGDIVNIRAAYVETIYEEQSVTGTQKVTVVPLFNAVEVKDLLNSQGFSIYEMYKELKAMSKEERQAKLQDSSYKSQLIPRAVVVAVRSEDVSRYVEIASNRDVTFHISILSRKGRNNIGDFTSGLSSEVINSGSNTTTEEQKEQQKQTTEQNTETSNTGNTSNEQAPQNNEITTEEQQTETEAYESLDETLEGATGDTPSEELTE